MSEIEARYWQYRALCLKYFNEPMTFEEWQEMQPPSASAEFAFTLAMVMAVIGVVWGAFLVFHDITGRFVDLG